MAIRFTPAQQKVLDARNHNILVSAAAGSGKTAVLVERIVRLITEGENPLDIDRLLVVTFTRAAASQMRERIGQALSARLRENPGSTHLQKQEVLLHNAQITTMDSFFTFLLRNYFSDIDLDPGFRQIDPTESRLIAAEVLQDFLEEKYAEKDPAFMRCVSFFCSGLGDREMEKLLTSLCDQAGSHPSPEDWLRERASDYDVPDEEALFETPWMRSAVLRLCDLLQESDAQYAAMENICLQPDGPDVLYSFLEEERQSHFAGIRKLCEDKEAPASACMRESGEGGAPGSPDSAFLRLLWEEIRGALAGDFRRYPVLRGKKYDYIDDSLKDSVKSMRDAEKTRIQRLSKQFGGQSAGTILAMMDFVKEPVRTLSNLAIEYRRRFLDAKKERHCIDFVDLEHFALAILAERQPDGSYLPRRAAKALRSHYAEILIDEYQDSNEVQELLLRIISGEDEDRYDRFMVGDIKQSIYRFRLARPEIFLEKYETYRPDDPRTERIELDQNFRSRGEVLDCVNMLFMRIMRREIGGVEYNDSVSLKKGAVFPGEEAGTEEIASGTENEIEAGTGKEN
ncbi:MAG: UvrD-helicase domain-containing protein, partial [Eubacteriales bacterium]|nr:UvrD-helicase domain-containing protein [Eubacteriales bacterium]